MSVDVCSVCISSAIALALSEDLVSLCLHPLLGPLWLLCPIPTSGAWVGISIVSGCPDVFSPFPWGVL